MKTCAKCRQEKDWGQTRKFNCATHQKTEEVWFCAECLVPLVLEDHEAMTRLLYEAHLKLYSTHSNPKKCGAVYPQCAALN